MLFAEFRENDWLWNDRSFRMPILLCLRPSNDSLDLESFGLFRVVAFLPSGVLRAGLRAFNFSAKSFGTYFMLREFSLLLVSDYYSYLLGLFVFNELLSRPVWLAIRFPPPSSWSFYVELLLRSWIVFCFAASLLVLAFFMDCLWRSLPLLPVFTFRVFWTAIFILGDYTLECSSGLLSITFLSLCLPLLTFSTALFQRRRLLFFL